MRLRYLAEVNPSVLEIDGLASDEAVTFVPLEDVWPGTSWNPMQARPKAAIENGYTRFCEGDVLLPKIHPTFQADRSTVARGLLQGLGAGTTELHVIRPRTSSDARYISYLFSTKPFLNAGEAAMIGVAGQKRVPTEFVRNYDVPVVDLQQQRAIADFLDSETARIDALIAKKQGMVALLDQRWESLLEAEIRAAVSTHGEAPLRHLTQLGVGIVITPAKWYAAYGVPALRGMNVKRGQLDTGDLVFLTDEGHRDNFRSRLDAGDIVVVRTGAAGSACVVPPEFDGANCIDVLIVRSSRKFCSKFVELVLNSAWTQRQVELNSVGSIQSHFNVSALKAVRVPAAPVPEQQRIADRLMRASDKDLALRRLLSRQLVLLREHRQALITAAVTGNLEVPGAAA